MKSLWDEIANDILDKFYGMNTEQLEYDTDRIIKAIEKRIDSRINQIKLDNHFNDKTDPDLFTECSEFQEWGKMFELEDLKKELLKCVGERSK